MVVAFSTHTGIPRKDSRTHSRPKISSRALNPFFGPGSVHSGSASWGDCERMFPGWLRVSSLPWLVPKQSLDSTVSPLWRGWVKGVYVFSCIRPPALLEEWPGSFMCHCGSTGVERIPNKSQHRKLTLEKKILSPPPPHSCWVSNPRPSDQESGDLPSERPRPSKRSFMFWSSSSLDICILLCFFLNKLRVLTYCCHKWFARCLAVSS